MPGVIDIKFRISGQQEIERALEGIASRSHKVSLRQVSAARDVGKAQGDAAKAGADAATKASQRILTSEEATAKARIRLIGDVNKAQVNAIAAHIAATKQATEAEKALHSAQETAARANNRRAAAGEIGAGAGRGFRQGVGMLTNAAVAATGLNPQKIVSGAVESHMALGQRAALLENASGVSKQQFDSAAEAKRISSAIGVDAGEVMGAFEKISGKAGGTGILATKDQMLELAKAARGAGIGIENAGDMIATMVNRGVDSKEIVKTFEAIVQQTKDGAVEGKDFATQLDASSGALSNFNMKAGEKIMTAGALTQLSRTYGRKSAAEATTAAVDFAHDITSHPELVQKLTGGEATRVHVKGKKSSRMVDGKMVETTEGDSIQTKYRGGVEVGTDASRTQYRDVNVLAADIIEGAFKHGNQSKLLGEGGIFTGTSAVPGAALIQAYSQGLTKDETGRYNLAKDGETGEITGRAAIEKMLSQAAAGNVAPGTSAKDFANVMATPQAQFAQSMEKLKNDLGDKLAPAIAELTPKAIQLAEAFGKTATMAIENPKSAAVALVAFTTALGVAEAGISAITGRMGNAILDKLLPKAVPVLNVQASVVNMAGGAGGVGGAAGTAAKGAGLAAFGVIGTGLALQGAAAAGVISAVDSSANATARRGEAGATEATNLATKIRHGGATAADIARAKELKGQLEGQGGGFFSRFQAASSDTADQMKKEGLSASTLMKAFASPATSAYAAALGGGEGQQKSAAGAAADLADALNNSKLRLADDTQVSLKEGATINIGNVGELAGAISRDGGLQGPKAQVE